MINKKLVLLGFLTCRVNLVDSNCYKYLIFFNPLSTNPTKWSNTLKQFVSNSAFDSFLGLAFKGLINL